MALIDKASLLMVPSTYEAGKLYNVLPSGNRAPDSTDQNSAYDQTRADFDFDRGSNAAATRIGSDGLLKKYRENKLLQSNAFSTSPWESNQSNREAVVSSGEQGYDGTNNAWLVVDTTGSGLHQITGENLTLSGINTSSVYAKAYSNSRYLGMAGFGLAGGNEMPVFDLENGTIDMPGTSSILKDAKIESVGDGWYRCSMTFLFNGTSSFSITLCNTATDNSLSGYTYTGTGTNGFYIQSAQLESGLVSTDYLDSTSVTSKAGVLVDLPRINYDANGENGALLLEPSRTNLNAYSEYIDGWSDKINVTLTPNAATSPEGVDNAYKIYPTATGSAYFFDSQNLVSGTDYSYSIFVKQDGVRYYQLTTSGGATSGNNYANFDLQEGTKAFDSGFDDADIEDYGNGWYRIYVVFTAAATGIGRIISTLIDEPTDGRLGAISKNGTDGSLVYGSVYEAGSYPSSYIPNHGESGGVTRAADVCTKTGVADLINDGDGTLYMEVTPTNFEGDQRFGISDNIGANRIVLRLFNPSSFQLSCVINSSVQVSMASSGYSAGNTYKIAGAWKDNDAVIYINGVQVATDTNCSITPSNPLTRISFDNGVGTAKWENPVTQTMYFPTRLTNAELATLTTL